LKRAALVTAAVSVGAGATAPEVPWWGQLIMALVSVALAYFGGRVEPVRE
jgi:membrane protein implicated in regulation of membrane protease activity